jgi:hypothetical protein
MADDGGVRLPAVSGTFYSRDPARLRSEIEACFRHPVGPGRDPRPWGERRLIGMLVPHAGLCYSGPVAAHAYLRLAEARRPAAVVIVGPDHWGRGPATAVSGAARWRTPLGDVETEHQIKTALRARGIPADDRGHAAEHSVEVQLPFLQVLGYAGPVIPIVMAAQDTHTVHVLAEALAQTVDGQDVTLVASSDLSHYLPHDRAVVVDRLILDALTSGDARRVLDVVATQSLTMCGAGPAAVVLEAGRRLGAGKPAVLRYATSGETGGDRDRVVGYTAAALEAA